MCKPALNLPVAMEFLNELNDHIDSITLLSAVGTYIDEAGAEEKGRLAVGLLGMIHNLAGEMAALSDSYAELLPRHWIVEG